MKKIALKAIPLACAITAPFFMNADEPELYAASLPNLSNSKLATSTGMQSAKPVQTQPTNQITPPAGPLVSNGADVYLTADFIWWKAEQDGLQYAYKGEQTTISAGSDISKGKMHQPDFRYEPGFKVGLGILCDHDNWDLFSQYTWLHVPFHATKDHVSADSSADNLWSMLPIRASSNLIYPEYTSMGAEWEMHFNVLDLELGRNFWISKHLTLRPNIGMKFSWIKQELEVEATGAGYSTTGDNWGQELEVKQFGVGLKGGINAAFYMWDKWSIYGDLALTGMWNHFNSERETVYAATPTAAYYKIAHVHQNIHPMTAVLECGLGLRFETIFSQGKYMYMLQAGWEDQVWFNQGAFVQTQFPSPMGNLGLEGLTIKTGFYF